LRRCWWADSSGTGTARSDKPQDNPRIIALPHPYGSPRKVRFTNGCRQRFHILRADNSLVVHFNFKTDEKAKIAHERLSWDGRRRAEHDGLYAGLAL